MKLNRFFTEEKIGENKSIVISRSTLVNQLKNVFRLVKDDEVVLFDNSGFDYRVSIESYGNDTVSFNVKEVSQNMVVPLRETYLFVSLVKKDNFEWISQKATELGVSHIIPLVSERTEKKDINIERVKKIIAEAAEQSGRGTLPILYEVTTLDSALSTYGHIKSIAWHTLAPKFVSQDVDDSIGAYIGPEGGWSPAEIDLFKGHGVKTKSLGPQVLRSETAVIAVLARLVF